MIDKDVSTARKGFCLYVPGMPMKTEDVNYTAKTFDRTAASIIQSLGVSDKNVDLAASVAEIAYGRLESWEKTTKAVSLS